jgi:hypothetical protein
MIKKGDIIIIKPEWRNARNAARKPEAPVATVGARTRQPVRTLGLYFSIPLLGGPPTCAEIWAALASHFQSP